MRITKYLEYTRTFNYSEEVINWIKTNLNNYLKKNEENLSEIEHIIDYLASKDAPKRLKKMSYKEAKSNTDKWNKKLQKQGNKIVETEEDIKIVLELEKGFKWVKLISENSYKREGFLMSHCVASYFDKDVEIFSLRDNKNKPHCTIEKNQQIKGKGNGNIHPKYINYVVSFLEWTGMEVRDSEMKNLGYFNIEKYKKYLSKETLKTETESLSDTPNESLTIGQKLDNSRIFTVLIGLLLTAFLVKWFYEQGLNLNLNIVNWTFLAAGLLLARNVRHFVGLIKNAGATVGEIGRVLNGLIKPLMHLKISLFYSNIFRCTSL